MVSGGVAGGGGGAANLTSVEFYDVTTGQWLSLPGLVQVGCGWLTRVM